MNTIEKNYISYHQGDLPIILSAPHGGEIIPETIEKRENGVFDKDDYTLELTLDIINEFERQCGKTPYAIIGNISRKIVDLNRRELEAYDDLEAKKIYDSYHGYIKQSEKEIEKKFDKGIYFDIHGQSHPKGYLEFGYLLNNDILQFQDEQLEKLQDHSSIKSLQNFSPYNFIEQLKGDFSMGTLMAQEGYDSIPSKEIPFAIDGNYFEGAYDTLRYGSLDGKSVSGIQIEFPYKNVRDTKEHREKCAKAFVKSILKFIEIHLGY